MKDSSSCLGTNHYALPLRIAMLCFSQDRLDQDQDTLKTRGYQGQDTAETRKYQDQHKTKTMTHLGDMLVETKPKTKKENTL